MSNSKPNSDQTTESPHCSKDPEKRARQLANLRPPWQLGEVPNPRGRPAAGFSVIEWMNVMADWPEDEIRKVADDAAAPASKRAGARRWLAAIKADPERDGREATAFVCSYTAGRPRQALTIHNADPAMERDIEAGRRMVRDPLLRALAKEMAHRFTELQNRDAQAPEIVAEQRAVVKAGRE